jgi:hypothetical protein
MTGLERISSDRPDLNEVLEAVHDFAEMLAGPDTRVCGGAPTHPSMNQLLQLVGNLSTPLYVRWENDVVQGYAILTSDGKHFLWGRDIVEATDGYGAVYDQRVADVLVMAHAAFGVWIEDVSGVPADEFFSGAMKLAKAAA